MAGELPVSPNMGSAVVFITVGTLGMEGLCMFKLNVHWYIERKGLNILSLFIKSSLQM